MDYVCNFSAASLIKELGLEPGGRVQKAVDEEFLRGVQPYVPMDTGALIDSGLTHTVVGSGEIVYDCDDKARRLYYGEKDWNWSNGGEQAGGLRGHQWAERYEQAGGAENMIKAAKEAMK
jgi:hypothetical protein